MGVGHVPQEPFRAKGPGADVQGRQRRRATSGRPVDLASQARGRWGEDQAAAWYLRHQFEIIDRNWRCEAGELDLIAWQSGVCNLVVFVEVKARASDRFGSAAGAVDQRKQRRLRILAARWFAEHPTFHGDMRFDVVAITGTDIDVITNAF